MIYVNFIVREIGEVCGYVAIPNNKGVYKVFAIIPMSGVNNVSGGYTNIKLVCNDTEYEEYEGGVIDVYGYQVQSAYEEETDILNICVFLHNKNVD